MIASTADLWDRFAAELTAFVVRRVADPDDAADVLQDVFLKLHAGAGALRDRERLAPWVYRVARNAVVDHYRARGRATRAATLPPDGDDAGLGLDPAAPSDDPRAVVARYVAGLVDSLPERYRQAVVLSELEGLPQSEVAARLGLTVSGAKSRVQRGRAMLRERLLECCHVELDRRGGVVDYRPRVACCPKCVCDG